MLPWSKPHRMDSPLRHVAEFVNVTALTTADGCRTRRIQVARIRGQFKQKVPHFRHHGIIAEERLVAHAPGDDAGMIPVDADHVAQTGFDAGFKLGVVRRVDRIGAAIPIAIALETTRAPETLFRPEQQADLVARRRKRRRVRIMRAANEIKSRVFHQLHVAIKPTVRHRVAPASVVLMHVCALEIPPNTATADS